jgi:hypothetical protein
MTVDRWRLPRSRWRKATYSTGNGACVEVNAHAGIAAVRDSQDPAGPVVIVSQPAWRRLVSAIKDNPVPLSIAERRDGSLALRHAI